MKKRTTYIISLIVITIILAFGLYFVYQLNSPKNRLIKAIATSSEINIAEIVPFEWDTMYVFEAYTSEEKINDTLGFESGLEGPLQDGWKLIVLTKDDKTVDSFVLKTHSQRPNFLQNSINESYTRNEAIFIKEKNNFVKK